ncbi:DUF1269 domain-containing protein [Agromyces sp. NPDC058484]|uniref:DUF1269 domain-containing protein n=1 Tax=Agromyces sp. NPDC058484 TaxID=3346524 RepID=UPI003664D36A
MTTQTRNGTAQREIVAVAFATPDGASRAAASLAGAYFEKIENAAVLTVRPDGTPKFIESSDWGMGRGALVGGIIGLIGGPLGVLAGSGIGALATRLRDTGFRNDQLRQLGSSLNPGRSALVVEIDASVTMAATELLRSLGTTSIVVVPMTADLSKLFVPEP